MELNGDKNEEIGFKSVDEIKIENIVMADHEV
jgi:hypothetical protein